MSTLVFTGDTTLENVYHTNAKEIYLFVVESIKHNLHLSSKEQIRVATIQLNDLEYHIDLPRHNFLEALKKASLIFKENNDNVLLEESESLQLKILEVEAR